MLGSGLSWPWQPQVGNIQQVSGLEEAREDLSSPSLPSTFSSRSQLGCLLEISQLHP